MASQDYYIVPGGGGDKGGDSGSGLGHGRQERSGEADNEYNTSGGGEYIIQGGPQFNSGSYGGSPYPSGSQGQGGYGGGAQGGFTSRSVDDFDGVLHHAQEHSGSKDNGGLFDKALGYLNEKKNDIANERVDEGWTVKSHEAMYGGRGQGKGGHDSETVGAGAAVQALKIFTVSLMLFEERDGA